MRELLAQRTRFNSRFFRALIVADQIKLSWVINSCWLWKTRCVVSLCGVWLRSDLPTPYFFIMVVTASFTFLNVSSAFRAVVLMAKPRSTFSETQTYNVTLCYKVFTKRLQIRRRTLFKVVTEEYRVEKWNYIATKKNLCHQNCICHQNIGGVLKSWKIDTLGRVHTWYPGTVPEYGTRWALMWTHLF